MAARVNASEVKELINTDLSDIIVTSSIDIASRFIDDVVVGKGLKDDRLADVELYLSAHFVAMRDQDEGAITEEKVGDGQVKYSGEFGKSLNLTRFGQMAIFLDTSGKLAASTLTQVKARFETVAPVDV